VLSTLRPHTRDGVVDMSPSCSAVGLHEASDLVRLHGSKKLRLEPLTRAVICRDGRWREIYEDERKKEQER
jgi:hypothetical protein